MADIAGTANQIRNTFRGMPPAKRWTAIAVGAGTLALMVGLVLWSQRPVYQVLFSGLSPEDAGKIVERLDSSRVPHRLEQGGSTILVPADRVHETRLKLAGEGALQGGTVGFEIFDSPKLGMTDFVQQLNYQRAIQGELARTIQSLASVEKARVHIVIPKHSIFSERDQAPSASAVIQLRPGQKLSEGQVQAIAQLISSSVPGLVPGQVSVIDTRGTLLSKPGADSEDRLPIASYNLQRSIETSLEERARNILERTVGPGHAVVRVAAVVEQKRVESTEEKYDPDSAVVRSEQRSEESTSGSSGAPQGIPGTKSNVPGPGGSPAAAAATASASTNNSSRSNETINYEVTRIVSRVSTPIVEIKRLSVAVLVDGTYRTEAAEGGATRSVFVPRTPEEIQNFEKLVKNAIGFRAERGDTVEIVSAPFPAGEETLPPEPSRWNLPPIPSSYLTVAKYLSSILLLLLLALLVFRPLIGWLSAPSPPAEEPYLLSLSTGREPSEGLPPGARAGAIGPGKNDIVAIATQEPQRAAQAIKLWLVQG
ncbi:MAG: flagellar basal-body MS-ring/collar protein FliF [Deltaproteobacteria bacterium]